MLLRKKPQNKIDNDYKLHLVKFIINEKLTKESILFSNMENAKINLKKKIQLLK